MSRNLQPFDYRSLAEKYNISTKVLDSIIKEVKGEFPDDKMLAELHIIRALKEYKKAH